jgi:thioredoxin reductase
LLGSTIDEYTPNNEGFTVRVGKQLIETACIVIATGSMPRKPSTDVSEEVAVDTTNSDYSERVKSRNITVRGGKSWQANLPAAFTAHSDKMLNKSGFIMTDGQCLTPIPRIYAIGEAANRMPPCVSTSMADGVVAAKAIQQMLD